jgi:hypothetical protein
MGLVGCPNCAQNISEAVNQCPYCGASLPNDALPATTPEDPIDPVIKRPAQPPFFAVSLLKLVVLSTCTFGLYNIYWFWRNWNRIRVSSESEITPSLRAFFTILYCYPCFIRIKVAGINRGVIPAPPMGILAICYILTALSWKLPGPLWLLCFFNITFLLPIQSYVNRINKAALPGHDPNSRFSVSNWIAVFVGGLLLILTLIGTFLPNQSPRTPSGAPLAMSRRA